ncbi:hypothetical protein FQN54_002608 [Arachnomyces sp. PD_36]|nr:hypothetical protein FQN54_002608 [Arachnomyces sp. PD_36]
MPTQRPRNYLLLTLDAYETLFHPRLPIATQYSQTARSLGAFNPLPTHLHPTENDVKTAFKAAFKQEARLRPNYGRSKPDFKGGPRQWWSNVIQGSFERAVLGVNEEGSRDVGERKRQALESLPSELVPRLVQRFWSREGYQLYDDVEPFFRELDVWKSRNMQGVKAEDNGFDQIIVGVVSNSDDRVPDILTSLGLKVGRTRAEGVKGNGPVPDAAISSKPGNDIDFVITSYEAGEEKPHRQIFDVAKTRGKACKQTAGDQETSQNESWTYVHVGDDEAKDYRGAIAAGWDSFYLPRNSQDSEMAYKSQGIKTISSLSELLPKLGLTPR